MKKRYIIFDIDGTLTNTKKVDDKCFIKAFEQTFNINIKQVKWGNLTHVTDRGITEEIFLKEKGRKPNHDEYELVKSNFIAYLNNEKANDSTQFKEIEGAKDFFNELRRNDNYQLGIATGCWEQSAKIKLAAIDLDLDGICFSNSDYHKSREAITQDVIEQLKKKSKKAPSQIVYFGDGLWDFNTCKNLGIQFIGIDIENDRKLIDAGVKIVFQNFANKEVIMKLLTSMV